jgi:hypothetical protein
MATQDACIIDEQWDADLDPASRVHTLVRVVKKCSVHSALSDADCREAVVNENVRKNVTVGIVESHFSLSMTEEARLALMEAITWSFDGSRNLTVSVPGIAAQDVTDMQADCDVQFGPNVVTITS